MTIRCSPDEARPTHHIVLNDRKGVTVGLTICDTNGKPKPFRAPNLYNLSPVTTTAFKQTSGQGGYDIFDYPYNPIVQDDTIGGRGNLDFERDSTKFYDSFRATTWKTNKAHAGPQEQYVTGAHRSLIQNVPGSVDWIRMTEESRYLYKRFQATGMTTGKVWSLLRRRGQPGALTLALYADNAGDRGSLLDSASVAYTDTADILMEWLNKTLAEALTNGAYYWLVAYANADDNEKKHWLMAVKEEVGSSYASAALETAPPAAAFDLYFRLSDADTEKTCIWFEHMEQQFCVISSASGAPKLYMMGYRGAADANTGQLGKLIDATQSWQTDELAGKVVLILDGPGKLEAQPWRTISQNGANDLTMDAPWTIEHTTSTVYAVLDDKPREITGHGLTAPVTEVVVSPTGVVYVCQGDGVTVRRLRAYNDAGTWRDFNDAANCQAAEGTLVAVYLCYMPQAQKFVAANNDLSGEVSVNTSTNASVPAWGTALTWGTAKPVDSKHRRINGLILHPDPSGDEAVWAFKTDMPYVIPNSSANPYPVGPEEFRTVRSLYNGVKPIRHDVYLYFPLLQGLMRYYGGTYTDTGPNLGEGLPDGRRGPVVAMVSYPGRFFAAVDGGASGYSSVLVSGGWHELYRAPKGQRIKGMAFQVIPGTGLDRLWVYQGNDLVWLPFPSDTNELNDAAYPYTAEWAVELSRMHSGMYDVQKMIRLLKIQSDRLEVDASTNRPICWFELDFRKDEEAEWTALDDLFTESPNQEVDFSSVYGVAGKRLKFRVRAYTRDANKTAVFLAIIIFCVMRVDVKEFTGLLNVLCEDEEPIGLREGEASLGALEKLNILKNWGDASNDSLLNVRCISPLLDGKMVFLNVGGRGQIRFRHENGGGGDAYLAQISLQDA